MNHEELTTYLPHAGAMSLLDTLLAWDETGIRCETQSHLRPGHPLAVGGNVLSVASIEYAAQAAALHANLCRGVRPLPGEIGMLLSVRNVRLHVADLNNAREPLHIFAQRHQGDARQAIYHFSLQTARGGAVASGSLAALLKV